MKNGAQLQSQGGSIIKKKNSSENLDNFSQKFSKIRLKRLLLSNFDIEGTIFQKFTEFRIFQT